MSGILFGLTALLAAYVADLMASHWGLDENRSSTQPPTRRNRSSRPKGQPSSRSPTRSTGMRSP